MDGTPSTIDVAIVCKDALVRTGLAAILQAARGLSVKVIDPIDLDAADATMVALLGRSHVVVGDYDSGLVIAQAARRRGAHAQARTAKTLVVSHRNGEADVRHALEAGVQGYLPIDCRPDELLDAVEALHRGQRALGRVAAQRIAESFGHDDLTEREMQVLRLVAIGDANKAIARRLGISVGTVKVHVRSIMNKLGSRSRTEAASAALRRGLIELEPVIAAAASRPESNDDADGRIAASDRPAYGGLRVVSRG